MFWARSLTILSDSELFITIAIGYQVSENKWQWRDCAELHIMLENTQALYYHEANQQPYLNIVSYYQKLFILHYLL